MVTCAHQICQVWGKIMNLKRFTAILVLACFNFTYVMPAFAITENNKNNQQTVYTHKVKKSKKENDDYKYAYVNMDFWKKFNDDNLNHYIDLAIKQNYDLKIASLTVKEYYQNMKLQFANELPSAGVGISPAFVNVMVSQQTIFQ